MAASYGAVTVSATATLILAADPARRGCLISNNGSNTVYLGFDGSVTTSTGTPISVGSYFLNSGDFEAYRGDIYGITATSTSDTRYLSWGV